MPYKQDYIYVKRKFISFVNNYYRIYDRQSRLLAKVKHRGFKLKEDIRIYSDEEMSREILTIKADRIIDFRAAYLVTDSQTGEIVGCLRRKGMSSIIRDSWLVFDAEGRELFKICEDSLAWALMRRLLTNLVPAKYHIELGGKKSPPVFQQNFNPFILHMHGHLQHWPDCVDKRLAFATLILLLTIEGRQGDN